MDTKRVIPIVIIVILFSASLLVFMNLPLDNQETETDQETDTSPGRDLAPTISLHASQTSPVSGIVTLDIDIEDEDDLTAKIYIDRSLVATSNSYEWNTSLYTEGTHTIRITATDSEVQTSKLFREVLVDNEEYSYDFTGTLKVLLYNIKESGFYSEWKQVVKDEDADIIMFVETGNWDDLKNEDFNVAVSEFNSYFENQTPYIAYCAQDIPYSTSGEAILSRFPIVQFIQIPVVTLDDGSSYDVTHDFIDAVIDINGTEVHVIGGHLKTSSGETNENRREWEMEGMINYMDSLGQVPIMYLSDQNSFSPADTGDLAPEESAGYGPMTMMLYPEDPVYGNYSSSVHEFIDVYRHLNPAEVGYTFGHQDDYLNARIDFMVVNSIFSDMLVNSTCGDALASDVASDHYAVDMFIEWNQTAIDLYTQDEPTYNREISENSEITHNETWTCDFMCQIIGLKKGS